MSKLTQEEQITLDNYNRSAKLWAEKHQTPGFWLEEMKLFNELLPKGRVLEIGAGGGRDAKELIELGYDYFGTDISTGLLEAARKNNPGAHFEESSIYDFDFEEPFDGFWCAAVLLHIPKSRINEALQSIKRNLVSEAVGFIAIKEGIGEKIENDSLEDGGTRLFAYWQNDEFKEVMVEQGFIVLHEGYRPMSERSKWLTYHIRSE